MLTRILKPNDMKAYANLKLFETLCKIWFNVLGKIIKNYFENFCKMNVITGHESTPIEEQLHYQRNNNKQFRCH